MVKSAPGAQRDCQQPDDYGKENFTLTGTVKDLLGYLTCPEDGLVDPDSLLSEPERHSVVTLGAAECQDGPVLYALGLFAQGIGPLVLGDWVLQYAYVDGVDYEFPED